jgi:hypothetical protein
MKPRNTRKAAKARRAVMLDVLAKLRSSRPMNRRVYAPEPVEPGYVARRWLDGKPWQRV